MSLPACRFTDVLLQDDERAREPSRLQAARSNLWGVARSSRTRLVSGVEGTPSIVATTWGVYGTGWIHVRRASLLGAVGYSRPKIASGQTALIRTRALMLCIDKLAARFSSRFYLCVDLARCVGMRRIRPGSDCCRKKLTFVAFLNNNVA